MSREKGSVDQSITVFIMDSTSGLPEANVSAGTSGLLLWYWREKQGKIEFSATNLASISATHMDYGIAAIGNGEYRLDPPDAAWASSADVGFVKFGGDASGMILIAETYPLTDHDPGSLIASVSGTLSTYGVAKGIKKSEAYSNFVFMMVDTADNALAGLSSTISATKILDTSSEIAVSGTVTEISGGKYQFDAAASDTSGTDVVWTFAAAGAKATVFRFRTV